ncbi:MAG: CTP synthase [Patescibacteria group bacterium]
MKSRAKVGSIPKTKAHSSATKKSQKKLHHSHKYIFVIGGVMSGVGKGIATSSIGTLLSAKGYGVNLVKVDPYLNVDAGTMNPTEHGEVFVLNSGLETDQDMGNYERFLGRDLSNEDYMTSGMIYKYVIDKERALGYAGKFVDADHVREEIVRRIEHSAKVNKSEITVVEIGGTVGDYQNVMFIEAARVLKIRHPHDVLFIMVSYLPVPGTIGEMKSKPTQNAVKQLNAHGVQADIIIARSHIPIDDKRREKLAFTCNVMPKNVIAAPDIESIYDVPVNFERGHLGSTILESLNLPYSKAEGIFHDWKKMARGIKNNAHNPVNIAIVGKYFNTGDFVLTDAYISVLEAIKFSAYTAGVKAVISTVNARDFEVKNPDYSSLDKYDGILVPGGFGESGIEGKLNVIRYARENKIPYFGLCYGMQLMTIEYARNVLGLKGAQTAEINPRAPHLIIDIMPDQKKKIAEGNYGGSMRLGQYPAKLGKGTIALEAYGTSTIKERHRHRYEVNPKYIEQIEKGGLVFSGKSPDGTLMEIAELPRSVHPFFLGTQFHPEFLARPLAPHPLFTEFMKASKARIKTKKQTAASALKNSMNRDSKGPATNIMAITEEDQMLNTSNEMPVVSF